jgi:hypothetical protein
MYRASITLRDSPVDSGWNSADLLTADRWSIKVSYTPNAPAVAELTIGLMCSGLMEQDTYMRDNIVNNRGVN